MKCHKIYSPQVQSTINLKKSLNVFTFELHLKFLWIPAFIHVLEFIMRTWQILTFSRRHFFKLKIIPLICSVFYQPYETGVKEIKVDKPDRNSDFLLPGVVPCGVRTSVDQKSSSILPLKTISSLQDKGNSKDISQCRHLINWNKNPRGFFNQNVDKVKT